ncbi:MAG: M3 family metallopeptidase [Flavobacteriaceae bacterium]|nr:M3 family metallopeptidase [Flavobacteriaceae bacterium]
MNDPKIRSQYEKSLKLLTSHYSKIGQNKKLFFQYERYFIENKKKLNPHQIKLISDTLIGFKLSGVHLGAKERKLFRDCQEKLANFESKFEQNILDSTNAWTKNFKTKNSLSGLPNNALEIASEVASSRGQTGYTLTLDQPSYMAIMMFANNQQLRKTFYLAYMSRASNKFPISSGWDNTKLIEQILSLRQTMSKILGYKNYAEYSLETKMAKSSKEVISFLNNLKIKALKKSKKEMQVLNNYAKEKLKIKNISPWDLAYVSEKYKEENFGVSQEELKKYFPVENVIDGLFRLVKSLYGINVKIKKTKEVWHPDVRLYEIYDKNKNLRGKFYLDLYARQNKRGGAWMDECTQRRSKLNGSIQLPAAFITCNSSPPTKNSPAFFTHYDVETLFHEFGHGLQHMLTKINYAGISGISGVEWDAVELPSQFMENWCWEKDVLDTFAFHYKTNKKLPDVLFKKLLATKNYNTGLALLRQIEFSLFDFLLHMNDKENKLGLADLILQDVRKDTALLPAHKNNKFQNSFAHIFSGGYAAGYYSYKWAEVLSADAFMAFKEKKLVDRKVGEKFMKKILETGGSKPALELFIEFRGREPKIEPLLDSLGLK